jgi:outer membrane protein assembly factor BamB
MRQLLPLLLLASPSFAQTPHHVVLPVGARVKIDTESGGPTVEGTIVGWRADTLLVQPQSRADTVRVPPAGLKKIKVMESPALWRYTSPSAINFFFSTSMPRPHELTSLSGDADERLLLVGNKTELAGVNPATGAVMWSRKDLADLKAVSLDIAWNSGFGIVSRRDTMEIFDLRTGLKRWDSGSLSFLTARGWLPSPSADTAVLMLGRTAQSPTTLMAIDIATGRVRWRQESAFTAEPKVFATSGVSYLLGHQSPIADSDTSLILYISTDGPIRLDARTGRVLWRGTALRGAKLPLPTDGYAAIRQQRGVVFIPSGDSLLAFRASDGTSAWTSPRKFKNRVFRIVPTNAGLLVRGYEWFDLLDPTSGKSLWRAPVETKNSTWDVLRGDTDYVADNKRVLAIAIADGTVRTIGTVDFKGDQRPTGLTVWKQGIILNSWHHLLLMDRQGAERYHREYPSPKTSLGELVNPLVTDILRPSTRWAGSHIFFFTGAADEQGREGFSIVEVDPTDGHEAARLWFTGRVPSYAIDDEFGAALYRRNDSTLEALPLLDGADLSYAARNGHAALVEQLLAMGADAAAAGDDGWTALHLAAFNGQTEVVRVLVAHGADVARPTREGWTPWLLARRERHDSLAHALRGSADSTSAAAGAAKGLGLARQGRIAEALAEVTRAAALDSTLGVWPTVWQSMCWNGVLAGQGATVLALCDRAVERTPLDDASSDGVRLSRAIARALTGNLEGAAGDLEADGSSADDGSTRGRWIAALRQGRNPFSPAVLATLRRY